MLVSGKRNDLKLPGTETFRNGFPEPLNHDANTYANGFFDMPSKFNVLDMLLSSTKPNGFSVPPPYKSPQDTSPQPPQQPPTLNGFHNMNGLDQNMSKFFSDFHNKTKEVQQQHQQFPPNGFPPNGLHHQHQGGFFSGTGLQANTEKIVLLQQKQIEDQLMNLSMQSKQGELGRHVGISHLSNREHIIYSSDELGFLL